MLFAADQDVNRWLVFAAASAALVLTSALGVVAGGTLSQLISEKALTTLAGAGFIVIGVLTLLRG